MDLRLNDEQRMIRDSAREFAAEEIAPIAATFDASGEFPLDSVRKMGELGYMGMEIPEELGGLGLDAVSHALALIEVSKADAAHGTIMSVNNSLFGYALRKFGTDAQREKYLRPVAGGEKIGAYSLTEPVSGSDASAMQSTAVRQGDRYLINGTKSWVTNGPVADYVIVFAMTDPDAGHHGITAFIAEAGEPGVEAGRKEDKLGIRASATCEFYYRDYACPVDNRLGEEGQGFAIAMAVLDAGRIGVACQSVGLSEAALEASVRYACEREAFGGPIGRLEGIQWKIADMKCRLEAARLLTLKAALAKQAAMDTGARFTEEASIAKLFASETAMFCAHQAVQIHGGMGYTKEWPIERYFRDAKITEIYEGTSEVQRLVIARHQLKLK